MKQPGFFDVEERLARLSGLGDQLEAFSRTVDFEVFRPDLELALAYSDGSKGGRPPFDPVLMFKILVIQTLNNLSDERTEYLINNRLSFMRFLGLGLSDRVPDAKTVWLFRERLTQAGAIERLFDRFDATLRNAGYLPMSARSWMQHWWLLQSSAIRTLRKRISGQDVFQKTGRTSPQRCRIRIVMHDGHLSSRRRSGRTMEPYRRAISPSRSLATNPTSPSTGSFGSSENGRRRMPPPVMVRD